MSVSVLQIELRPNVHVSLSNSGIPHCTCLNYDNVFFFSHLSFFSLLHIYVSRLESEQPLVFSGSSSAIIFLTFLSLRIGAIRCCVDRTLKE